MSAPARIVLGIVCAALALPCLVSAQNQNPKPDPRIASLTERAANGDSDSQFRLGFAYDQGRGVEPNAEAAVHWYKLSADHGNHAAQNNLANLYANGRGVAMDKPRAAMWYLRAASEGYAPAQNNAGYMYANGFGVTADDAA